MNLSGKTAVITGSTSGIGLGIARKLAEAGADIVLNSFTSKPEDHQLANALAREFSVKARYCSANMRDPKSCRALIENLQSCDILINNAGIQHVAPIDTFPVEKWDEIIAINLSAAFHTSAVALGAMRKAGWGRIINISSAAAALGNKGQSNYVAAKAGIEAMSKTLAREVGSKNIAVNCVAPGFIETDMLKDLDQDYLKMITGEIPLQRFGKTEEIASLVKFLSSDEANYITGQTVHINGGLFM